LQFLEKQAGLLVDILKKSIYKVDVEDHFNIPRGLQDEGVPVDDVNLETGDDQLHNTTVGSQDDDTFAFDFQIDQFPSPPWEPGLLLVSCTRQVFDVGPESEPDGEEELEEEPDQDGDTYVWFKPDVWSEAEGDDDNEKLCWIQDEDTRLMQGEDTSQLNIEQDLHNLGSKALTTAEKDTIKAMVLKIGNQLTRKCTKEFRNSPKVIWRLEVNMLEGGSLSACQAYALRYMNVVQTHVFASQGSSSHSLCVHCAKS